VKEQWLISENEKVIVGKACGRGDVRHEDREAIHVIADLVDFCFHN
jgi:hypothetical protein